MQHPTLSEQLASALAAERLETAERRRRSRVEWTRVMPDPFDSVTVRRARPGDGAALQRLAEVDGRRLPPGPMLVAEVAGKLLAARSLVAGASIADPFHPSAHLVELLELRSAHLRERPARRRIRVPRGRTLVRALTAQARS
jgi:hypothetical protein